MVYVALQVLLCPAWFSIIDEEWSELKSAYDVWLSPDNFDERAKQKQRLNDVIEQFRPL